MTTITVILIVLAAIVISSAITSLVTSGKMRAKVAYMLDALEDKELNFRFDERRWRGRKFNRTLNRLVISSIRSVTRSSSRRSTSVLCLITSKQALR